MLIYGIMKLNKVPASSSKFELLPVDIICKVLLQLGLSEKNIGGTYGILEMVRYVRYFYRNEIFVERSWYHSVHSLNTFLEYKNYLLWTG